MKNRINNLFKEKAELRSKAEYSNILYDLFLNLKNNENDLYSGILKVSFNVQDLKNVFINYSGDNISKLNINNTVFGEEYLNKNWVDDNLFFEEKLLKKENNIIIIFFENKYSKLGDGLCLTVGTDKLKYKYTQSEPYFMNKVFPCFDQPDLKANINININCDKEDTVLSINKLKQKFENKNDFENYELKEDFDKLICENIEEIDSLWKFETSFKLSTYLYGISCGPLIKYEMKENELYKNIPTNIYCRKSKKALMDKQYEIILYHMREAIKFYDEFFLVDYPFKENNFIFMPEYRCGAMEYPGCVTMNEVYIFEENESFDMIVRRNKTVYHELAHMWFGNLVTMKWWDDLWLNESFADFIAFNAMQRVKGPYNNNKIDPWIIYDRERGYQEDELNSTHPIYLNVINTIMADSIFDGITYSKGCGCLIQLINNIGWDNFKINIQNYFKKYQWKNATLDDFLNEMKNNIIDFDIEQFKNDYILKECLNYLSYERKKDHLLINQDFVLQKFNYLRIHKLKIIIYDKNMNTLIDDYFIVNKSKETIIKFSEEIMNNAEAIIINADNIAWCKFKQDLKTNEFIFKNLEKFMNNQLYLKTFIMSVFEQVRDGILKSDIFMDYIYNNMDVLVNELSIMRFLPTFISSSINNFSNKKIKKIYSDKFFTKSLNLFLKNNDNNIKKKLLTLCLSICNTKSSKLSLFSLMRNIELKEFDIGIKTQILIYFKMITIKEIKKYVELDLIKLLNLKDDLCQKFLLKYKSFRANTEEKKRLMKVYCSKDDTEFNYIEKQFSYMGFILNKNNEYDYRDDYFNNILNIFRNNSYNIGRIFLKNLRPHDNENPEDIKNYINRYEKILGECKENETSTKNCLITLIDSLKKKLKAISLI